MGDSPLKVKVAVVQAASRLFDRAACVEKTCRLIGEVARQGAKLILFPESFIPAYPRGFTFGTVVGSRTESGRKTWEQYWRNSLEIPSEASNTIGEAARQAQTYVAIGVIERDTESSQGTLYDTLLYFGPDGKLLGKHRKLKPTALERVIWGEGDGSTLTVFNTNVARIGGLICWENYMPLARMALYQKGVEIYLAPTADARERWQSTLRHIALEGRCFVLGCNHFMTKSMYPSDLIEAEGLSSQPEILCRGGSAIVSPSGEYLAGPLFDKEGILLADLDLAEVVRGKFDFDVVGHYARPDVFHLIVNERPMHSVTQD
jgi:nitrilase